MILRKFRKDTWEYRNRFGNFRGVFVYKSILHDRKLDKNSLFSVKLPEIKHSFSLRAKTSDFLTFQQLYIQREVDVPIDFQPKIIVDAGANIGLSSVYYASKYPGASIWAIEMESVNYEMLVKNTKPYNNIFPLRRALWGSQEKISIINPSAEEWAYRADVGASSSANSVVSITIDNLLDLVPNREIDFLKLDIEGAELNIFQSTNLSWLDHVKVMAIELHDRFQPGCTEALMSALNGRTYKISRHGEYEIIDLR